eukprot:7760988-Pyramimonas_sp.AAC.1
MKVCAQTGESHHEWRLLKTLLRYGGRPGRQGKHLQLADGAGAVLENEQQEAQAITQHFAGAEDAGAMTVTSLQTKCNDRLHREILAADLRPGLVVPPCR